jgi:hypothetical protein
MAGKINKAAWKVHSINEDLQGTVGRHSYLGMFVSKRDAKGYKKGTRELTRNIERMKRALAQLQRAI